jgi:spore maturation protein CgeB
MQGPLLCIHPGADWSTGDVYQGLIPALKRLGVPVVEYPLNATLQLSHGYLDLLHRKQKKHGGPLAETRPTSGDVLYHASAQAIERALFFGCEWVLLMTGMYFSLRVLKMLRRAGLKIAVLLTESPYDTSSEFAFAAEADLCWTTERTAVAPLGLACPRTGYLPHAYDPEKHRPDAPLPEDEAAIPAHDVVFVGSGFQERVDLLSAIDWTGIDFGLYGAWRGVGPRHRLRKHLRGQEVDNAVAAALYRKARIGLNLFRSSVGHAGKRAARMTGAASLNPRLLELAACGAFTVSEWRPEVGEVFGGSVPTFRDAAGLQSLLREWLPRGADRERRARSLPGRVAGRTFDGMARTVVRDLVKADADGEPWAPLEERLGVA